MADKKASQIIREARKLLVEYPDVDSLDRDRDVLEFRYGISEFDAIHEYFSPDMSLFTIRLKN